jgi:hypothetical protein
VPDYDDDTAKVGGLHMSQYSGEGQNDIIALNQYAYS